MNTITEILKNINQEQAVTYAVLSVVGLLIALYKAGTQYKTPPHMEQYEYGLLQYQGVRTTNNGLELICTHENNTVYYTIPTYVYAHSKNPQETILEYYNFTKNPTIEAHINQKNPQDFRIIDDRF